MLGVEEVNATEIELLDRFGCIQVPDRKGAVGKGRRKSEDTSLRPEALLTNWESNGGRSENLNSCSAK